jgi:hypothetical protein
MEYRKAQPVVEGYYWAIVEGTNNQSQPEVVALFKVPYKLIFSIKRIGYDTLYPVATLDIAWGDYIGPHNL